MVLEKLVPGIRNGLTAVQLGTGRRGGWLQERGCSNQQIFNFLFFFEFNIPSKKGLYTLSFEI